ncbi:MAG: VWA domain-containing protein [Phycisphaerae bacterium]|nr:VWA domain-containing protein [Phycisphaerae bacterium]
MAEPANTIDPPTGPAPNARPAGVQAGRDRQAPRAARDARATQVDALRQTIERMHEERSSLLRQRRVHLLLLGLSVSLPFHIMIMIWLASIYMPGPVGDEPPAITFELGVLNDERLADGPSTDEVPLIDLTASAGSVEGSALEATTPAIGMQSQSSGSLEAAGGAPVGEGSVGGGGSLGPGGGGSGGTSFFGVGGRGSRFAYIVDISGSMANGTRFSVAIDELKRSITALPDFASFVVVLFSSASVEPPFQESYLKAHPSNVARMKKWIDTMSPMGGTDPGGAFQRALGLSPPPDIIFFLTDGEIPPHMAEVLSASNGAGGKKRVVIHTIAFSTDAGQEILRKIARDSEGTFRYVPAGGS